jgi:repressor LexA
MEGMIKMKKLTDKQEKILDFISSEINIKGYPPSVRDICKAVGLKSTSTVHGYLNRLEKYGYIKRDPLKPRALKILLNDNNKPENDTIRELIDVPIVGKVTAGEPILAVENIEDTFPLPIAYAKNKDLFALRVSGESMIEAGILDGDLVIVSQQNTAKNGDIVVALIEDEATVKRFYKEEDYFRLQPDNKYMYPIIVKELSILGVVVGLYRQI